MSSETKPRVWLAGNRPGSGRWVPQADMVAVAAYEASPQCTIDTWLSFEREYHEMLLEEAAEA